MERNVKVRIDLLLDNQADLLDTFKAINAEVDKLEKRQNIRHNLAWTGDLANLQMAKLRAYREAERDRRQDAVLNRPLNDEIARLNIEKQIFDIQERRRQSSATANEQIRLLQEKHREDTDSSMSPVRDAESRLNIEKQIFGVQERRRQSSATANEQIRLLQEKHREDTDSSMSPVRDAESRLNIEKQIFGVQEKRRQLQLNRPQEIEKSVQDEYLARERAEIARAARYQARFGRFGPAMGMVDRFTMSGMGYAAMSGAMVGAASSAGSTATDTLLAAMRRAAGEIGLMFIPAIMRAAQVFHDFAGFIRNMNPTLRSAIANIATWGLALSAGAKVISVVANGFVAIKEAVFGTAMSVAVANLNLAATNLNAAAIRLRVGGAFYGGGGAAGATAGGAAAGGAAVATRMIPFVLAGYAIKELLLELIPPTSSIGRFVSDANDNGIGVAGARLGLNAAGGGVVGGAGNLMARSAASSSLPLAGPPGFQSQQIDIFAMKDMVQRESIRSPLEQANFNLAVEEFKEAVRVWERSFSGGGEVIGAGGVAGMVIEGIRRGLGVLVP